MAVAALGRRSPAVSYQSSEAAAPASATPPGPSSGQGYWAVRGRPIDSPQGTSSIVIRCSRKRWGMSNQLVSNCNGAIYLLIFLQSRLYARARFPRITKSAPAAVPFRHLLVMSRATCSFLGKKIPSSRFTLVRKTVVKHTLGKNQGNIYFHYLYSTKTPSVNQSIISIESNRFSYRTERT